MKLPIRTLALLPLLAAAAGQAATCYTVYGRSNEVLYFAATPPVDMSYQLHQTLPRVFPGATMVFGDGGDCPLYNTVPVRVAAGRAEAIITEPRAGAGARLPRPDRN